VEEKLNKKTFLGAVCALACATNIFVAQPHADAMMNAHEQEKWARHLEKEAFGGPPETSSEEAIRLTPIIQGLQKRLCDRNGIEITTTPFQNTYDFETKIHPMQVIDNYHTCYSVGAGYIYFNARYLSNQLVGSLSDQYAYILAERAIAHEMGHALGGHTTSKKFHNTAEILAEKKSVELMDKLPEGGWGAYLVSVNIHCNRPDENFKVVKSFVDACDGRITMPTFTTTVYHDKGGGQNNLCLDNYSSNENAYFGGQMAYCIAHRALSVEGIEVVENFLKDEIKFKGDYLLICRSSSLPNGYRVLASLYGSRDKVLNDWSKMKGFIANGHLIDDYDWVAKETFHKDDGKNQWAMWLALAVAYDVQH